MAWLVLTSLVFTFVCIDEVEVDVVPLDVCGVVFRIPYMYMRDVVFMKTKKLILSDQGW